MPRALNVDWKPIRSAIESGANYAKVSELFGVPEQTLRKQASRNKWISPGVVKNIIKREEAKRGHSESQSLVTAAISESWADKAESHRRMMFEKTTAALKNAKFKAPENWRDAEIADKMARKAVGLESGDSHVNLAIAPLTWGLSGSRLPGSDGIAVASRIVETESPPLALDEDGGDETD